jgi:hypothetical protein
MGMVKLKWMDDINLFTSDNNGEAANWKPSSLSGSINHKYSMHDHGNESKTINYISDIAAASVVLINSRRRRQSPARTSSSS